VIVTLVRTAVALGGRLKIEIQKPVVQDTAACGGGLTEQQSRFKIVFEKLAEALGPPFSPLTLYQITGFCLE
jgi:hypothetical protein